MENSKYWMILAHFHLVIAIIWASQKNWVGVIVEFAICGIFILVAILSTPIKSKPDENGNN
jgi:hypothetical protein